MRITLHQSNSTACNSGSHYNKGVAVQYQVLALEISHDIELIGDLKAIFRLEKAP